MCAVTCLLGREAGLGLPWLWDTVKSPGELSQDLQQQKLMSAVHRTVMCSSGVFALLTEGLQVPSVSPSVEQPNPPTK